MKRKVKKYAGGEMVTSRGGDTNMRTRTDEEFAEDSKFGGYGRYMPKTRSITLGGKSSAEEDRPKSSGTEDYASMGARSGATSMMSGAPSIKEETPQDIYEPDSVAGEGAKNLAAPIKKKKPRVVSKRDLEESGLSLRDYLNKERGLTRKGMKSGGKVSSASSRADGIAQRGKTRGRMC